MVLFIFRPSAPIVFFYVLVLLSILKERIDELVRYRDFGAVALTQKYDSPGIILLLLGTISIAMVLIRATVRFIALVRNAHKSGGRIVASRRARKADWANLTAS